MDSKSEIINRLIKLDREVYLSIGNDNIYYELTMVGGSALALIDKMSRNTTDIDTIKYSRELQPFFHKYEINADAMAYLNNFSPDFIERRVLIDIPTKIIKFYSVSLEDIVISKISSPRPKDHDDIRNEIIINSLDWNRMDEIVNNEDFKDGMLNDHQYFMFMCDYRDYKEEVMK